MATCNPSELIAEAKCFQCLSNKELKAVIAQLLCNISGGGTGNCNDRIILTSLDVGNFILTYSDTVISISFPNAIIMDNGALILDNLSALTSFSAPFVQSIADDSNGTSVQITNDASLTSIDLSSLQSVTASITIDNDPSLTIISLPALTTIGGSLTLDMNNVLDTISLPALTSVTGSFFAPNNPLLTTLSADNLATVGGDIDLSFTALSSISLPSLVSISGVVSGFNVSNNASLTSISLPSLTTIASILDASSCPNLTSFNAPNWVPLSVASSIFTGDALDQTSVEQILARGVASGCTGAIFDLSGGTNFGIAGLSPAGAANLATLIAAPNTVLMNP